MKPLKLSLIILLTLALAGCVPNQRSVEPQRTIALPEPTPEAENMILGERLPSRQSNVSLYYAISDGATFSQVKTGIRVDAGESLPEAAARALMNPSSGQGLYFETDDIHMLSCEYACGLATVNLSLDALGVPDEAAALALTQSIGNTLLGIEGVRGVNVLINGRAQGFGRLPAGVQTEGVSSVTAAYAQIQAERDHLKTGDPLPITREAALYFPTSEGSWLIPELRTITFESDDFAGALMEALRAGPLQEACAKASVPAGVDLLEGEAQIQTLDTGERALILRFSPALDNYMVFSGLEMWELAGSLTLTACSFLPALDGVRILSGGEAVTSLQAGSELMRFEDGLIRREDFEGYVGSVATLYLADDAGGLHQVRRSVSTRAALSPRNLLDELFYYTDRSGALTFPVPEEVFADDILGVQLSEHVAQVNLSANFYRCCQSLDALRERALVYCMVDTLCALEDIRAVRFYVEGLSADTLAGSIYLKSPLVPDAASAG